MDREKVISGLEYTWEYIRERPNPTAPPKARAMTGIMEAIKLLKKQEPKQVEAEVINEIDRLYRCPSCHISMILRKQPYCHSCGQAVKWE